MKQTLILSIITITLSSCWLFQLPDQTFEYNPQKAGAEITKKISISNGQYESYIDCTNNHLYLMNTDNVAIFDITNDGNTDKINIIKTISFDIHSLYNDTTTDKYKLGTIRGVIDLNNKITLCAYVVKMIYNNQGEYTDCLIANNNILNLNFDYDGNWDLSDFPIDIRNNNIVNVHYDKNGNNLYIVTQDNRNEITVSKYIYNNNSFAFVKEDKIIFPFQYGNYFYKSDISLFCICYDDFPEKNVINKLYVFQSSQSTDCHEVDLTYLGLRHEPLSVFYYENCCWLYVREYDSETKQYKYELLKLKLLE